MADVKLYPINFSWKEITKLAKQEHHGWMKMAKESERQQVMRSIKVSLVFGLTLIESVDNAVYSEINQIPF